MVAAAAELQKEDPNDFLQSIHWHNNIYQMMDPKFESNQEEAAPDFAYGDIIADAECLADTVVEDKKGAVD